MTEVGKKIRTLREVKGYSQEYMADKMEISQRTYSKLENGQMKMDLNRFQQIANILDVDAVNLLNEPGNVFNNYSKVENFGNVENFGSIYISSKEYIEHLLQENKYLKEQNEKLLKLLDKKS